MSIRSIRSGRLPLAFVALVLVSTASLASFGLISSAQESSGQENAAQEKPVVGPENGYVMAVGGGMNTVVIGEKFIQLGGGKDANFVVIPTAENGEPTGAEGNWLKRLGVKNVTMLHTYDRKVADSEEFVAPLKTATAVWFSGGRQWRLEDAYVGTRTQEELFKVLNRGGVMGGSSAGATILGSFLVRGSPQDNRIMIDPHHTEGFGFLRNVAIDQHILTRGRENGLSTVVDLHPELLGIGIDEQTAIVVHGDEFEVIGNSKVEITDKNHPADSNGKYYYFLSPGQKFNLRTRQMEAK